MQYGAIVVLLIRTKTIGNGDEICYFRINHWIKERIR